MALSEEEVKRIRSKIRAKAGPSESLGIQPPGEPVDPAELADPGFGRGPAFGFGAMRGQGEAAWRYFRRGEKLLGRALELGEAFSPITALAQLPAKALMEKARPGPEMVPFEPPSQADIIEGLGAAGSALFEGDGIDIDAALAAYEEEAPAGWGYRGAAEIAASAVAPFGLAKTGIGLAARAPKLAETLGRIAPAVIRPGVTRGIEAGARGAGQVLRAPWEVEEAVGRGALKGLGFAARSVRHPMTGPLAQTVSRMRTGRQAPPFMGEVTGEVPPDRPSPRQLLQDPQDFDTQIEVAFTPNRARAITERLADTPVIGKIIKYANRSAVARSFMERTAIGRAQLQDVGTRAVQRALSYPRALGTMEEIFGPTDKVTGLLQSGPLAGRSVNEIAENPSRFPQLTDPMKSWLRRMGDVEEASFQQLKRNGVDIERIPEGEVERYAGRIVVTKTTPEGELIESAFVGAGPGRRLGGKISQQKSRVYPTVEAAQKDGFVFMPYDQAVALKTQAAMNRVINKRTADYILKNLPEDIKVRTTAIPERFVIAARDAQRNLKAVQDAQSAAHRALRGESLPGATLRSIRNHTPDLGEELDRALAITPTEFTTALNRLSTEFQQAMGVTREQFRSALAQVRLRAGKAERLNVRDITPGELTAALKAIGKDQRMSNRMLTEIYKNAFTLKNAERNVALRRVLTLAQEKLPLAQSTVKAAVKRRAAARTRARKPRFGEVKVDLPGLEQRFLKGPGAQQFRDDFTRMMQNPEVSAFWRGMGSLNAVQRIFVLAGDASPFFIQFLAANFRHPLAMFKSGNVFAKTLVQAIFDPAAARQAQHVRINANRELLDKYHGVILSTGGNEFTEGLARGGLLESKNLFGKGLSSGERLRAIPSFAATPLRPFQMAFESAMDEAAIHITRGLDNLAQGDASRINIIADYVNHIRGLSSSAKLGTPPNQRMVESAILLAPRYRRAVAALHASVLQGGLRGSLARRAYLHLGLGLFFTYAGISIALGVQSGKSRKQITDEIADGLNPTHSRFLLFRIGGQLVGPGSKFISDLRLLGKAAATGIDVGKGDPLAEGNLLDFDEFQDNPGVRWIRGQLAGVPGTAWDVFSGEYYLGEPLVLNDPSTWARTLGNWTVPIWVQSVLFEGGTESERATRGAAEFGGLRTFPQGGIDILIDESWGLLGKPYDETEKHEKEILRELLKGKLVPLRDEQVERGRELDTFFAELDDIEQERRAKLLELDAKGYNYLKFKSIEDRAAGRRFQAGVGIEFEEGNPEDPDHLKAALAQRNQLFGDPNLRTDAGTLREEFRIEMKKLEDGWTQEQRAYVARNTNTRPIPIGIVRQLPEEYKRSIVLSQTAREQYFIDQGKPELARLSRRYFSLEPVGK